MNFKEKCVKLEAEQVLSEKIFAWKNFLVNKDFENNVFRNPDFGHKTGSGSPGDGQEHKNSPKVLVLVILEWLSNQNGN